MAIEDIVCPHCSCLCEDNEYCAACGRLFHEGDYVEVKKISLLEFIGKGLRSLLRKTQESSYRDENDELLNIEYLTEQADQELDASWSPLSSNRFHDMKHG